MNNLSDDELKRAYDEACKKDLASDFIEILRNELIIRGIFQIENFSK